MTIYYLIVCACCFYCYCCDYSSLFCCLADVMLQLILMFVDWVIMSAQQCYYHLQSNGINDNIIIVVIIVFIIIFISPHHNCKWLNPELLPTSTYRCTVMSVNLALGVCNCSHYLLLVFVWFSCSNVVIQHLHWFVVIWAVMIVRSKSPTSCTIICDLLMIMRSVVHTVWLLLSNCYYHEFNMSNLFGWTFFKTCWSTIRSHHVTNPVCQFCKLHLPVTVKWTTSTQHCIHNFHYLCATVVTFFQQL